MTPYLSKDGFQQQERPDCWQLAGERRPAVDGMQDSSERANIHTSAIRPPPQVGQGQMATLEEALFKTHTNMLAFTPATDKHVLSRISHHMQSVRPGRPFPRYQQITPRLDLRSASAILQVDVHRGRHREVYLTLTAIGG